MIAVAVILRTLSRRGAKAKGTKDLTVPASVSVERAPRACSLNHAVALCLPLFLWSIRSAHPVIARSAATKRSRERPRQGLPPPCPLVT